LLIFVRQGLSSIMAMDIATSDEDWIKSQNAHDLATLFGVKHDRLLRLLETFGRANNAAVVEEDEEE
jgi:phage regulator Rha-like protein